MSVKEKSAHEGHRRRLRERYRQNGTEGFSDHELLELILGYAISQKDTNPIGHALIDRFGNLRGVLNADPQDLVEVEGVGDYSAFLLSFLRGIANRYYEEGDSDELNFSNPARYKEFFINRFVGCNTERLYAAFLDENYNLIHCEKQYDGSASQVEIHGPRIMKAAQRCCCRYVLIAHNHLTQPHPSQEDIQATRKLQMQLQQIRVGLLDHVVVCGSRAVSMRERGDYNGI